MLFVFWYAQKKMPKNSKHKKNNAENLIPRSLTYRVLLPLICSFINNLQIEG